jgi:iron(III) transport system permease protein
VAAGVGRSLIRLLREQRAILAGAAAAVAVCCALPLGVLLAQVATSPEQVAAAWSSPRPWILAARSLGLSLVVTAVALFAGVPLGVIVGRTDAAGRRAASLLHALPVFLPPFLLALGWFHVFGRRGSLGSEATSRILFSEAGAVLVLALAFTPVVTSFVALALNGIDPSLEEAARVVARPVRVVVGILLPAAAPAIALSAIVVFALSFSELGVPMFLRVDAFPSAVFARLGGADYAPGEAFALVLPLAPVALVLLALERRFVGRRSFAVLGLRASERDPFRLGRWRAPGSALVWIAAGLSSAPVLTLFWRGWQGDGFAQVGAWLGRAPGNGLVAGAAAATLITLAGLVVGHAVARGLAGSRLLDALAVLAFVTPAAVLGVGIIDVWNRPALRAVYGSLAVLVVGYVGRYMVIGVRTLAVVVSQSAPQLEEAAAVAGAGFGRRLIRIVAPLHARGLAFAWLLALVFCLRDLETAVLFYPPGGEPTTVRIFTLEANGLEPVVAALASTHVIITAVVLIGGAWIAAHRGRA